MRSKFHSKNVNIITYSYVTSTTSWAYIVIIVILNWNCQINKKLISPFIYFYSIKVFYVMAHLFSSMKKVYINNLKETAKNILCIKYTFFQLSYHSIFLWILCIKESLFDCHLARAQYHNGDCLYTPTEKRFLDFEPHGEFYLAKGNRFKPPQLSRHFFLSRFEIFFIDIKLIGFFLSPCRKQIPSFSPLFRDFWRFTLGKLFSCTEIQKILVVLLLPSSVAA